MRYILCFIFFVSFQLSAQVEAETKELVVQTQNYIDAYIKEDFEKLIRLTHPNIISLGGGPRFVINDLMEDKKAYTDMGFKYLDGKVGKPGAVHNSENELLCFIPQVFTIEINGEKFNSESYLLASSSTKGKTWSFVSLERQDQESITIFVPNYNEKMSWPKKTEFSKVTELTEKN